MPKDKSLFIISIIAAIAALFLLSGKLLFFPQAIVSYTNIAGGTQTTEVDECDIRIIHITTTAGYYHPTVIIDNKDADGIIHPLTLYAIRCIDYPTGKECSPNQKVIEEITQRSGDIRVELNLEKVKRDGDYYIPEAHLLCFPEGKDITDTECSNVQQALSYDPMIDIAFTEREESIAIQDTAKLNPGESYQKKFNISVAALASGEVATFQFTVIAGSGNETMSRDYSFGFKKG